MIGFKKISANQSGTTYSVPLLKIVACHGLANLFNFQLKNLAATAVFSVVANSSTV
jgi:hypothetical protein